MDKKEKTTFAGKWSVALALIPMGGVLLFLLASKSGDHSGEAGLAVMLAIGVVLYGGSHIAMAASLLGAALGVFAIHKTRWRQGGAGLVLNISVLILAGAYLTTLYRSVYVDPDRLPIAANRGEKKTVERLLKRGFDINRQLGGDTALSNAARAGHEEIVGLLLAHEADVITGDPVSGAAHHGHEKIVKLLLEHGADPNCLHIAVSGRNKGTVKLLLEHKADVNHRNKNRRTPLHIAVTSGTEEIVKLLISKGADVNAKDSKGLTPLHVIVRTYPQHRWGEGFREKMIDMLLAGGANIEAKTREGKTPLYLAAEAINSGDAVKTLLGCGADPDKVGDVYMRFIAAPISMNKPELEEWVRANAEDINAKNNRGESLLHSAVKGRNEDVVEILLSLGADVNSITNSGDTVLHWALRKPQPEIIDLLISKGADINARNKKGKTPLHELAKTYTIGSEKALEEHEREVFETLLANGARIDIDDNDGRTPLEQQQNWLPQSQRGRLYRSEVIKLMQKYQKKSIEK